MFRHQGKSRTFQHNVKLATVLSFVAGIVNATGFLAIQQLTTNVTGHFALFINDLVNYNFWHGAVFLVYILSFLLGSFTSSLLIEFFRQNQRLNVFLLPIIIESLILLALGIFGKDWMQFPNYIASALLFAMGMQNSLVTKISSAVVRTTHLTGLFTDLGIDLSHLFSPGGTQSTSDVKSSIRLRIFIIAFFFLGGLAGGYCYAKLGWELRTLLVCTVVLIASLFYDDLKYKRLKSNGSEVV